MNIIHTLEQEEIARLSAGKTIPEFRAGDTVNVLVNVIEGSRKRTQAYEGVVIAKRNRGLNSSFIVRKISSGEGVERTFQLYSPTIASIEVKRRGDVRRAKLSTTCANVPARLLASANSSSARKTCRLLLNNFSRTHEMKAASSAFGKPREVICFAGLFCICKKTKNFSSEPSREAVDGLASLQSQCISMVACS